MARVEVLQLRVYFGDCDPAGIVFYPNFFRWFDCASRHFFDCCGLPQWRDLERERGILGTPLVEASNRFLLPLSYGDAIEVHTSIAEWHSKVFVQKHEIFRAAELVATGHEKRVFARRDESSGRIHAIAVPADLRTMCE